MTAPSRSPAALLNAARSDDSASLDAVAWLILEDEGVAAAKALLNRPELDVAVRWAAVYVYGGGGADPEPLLPVLQDADPSVRLLGSDGSHRARPLRGIRAGRGGPQRRADSARQQAAGDEVESGGAGLVRHTLRADLGPPLDADAPLRARCQQRWQDWLSSALPSLRFDPATAEWTSP